MVNETNVGSLSYSIFFNGDKFNRNKIKESWVKSHYPIDYSNIEVFCQEKKLNSNVFSQKVYHYLFNLNTIPICSKCNIKNKRYKGFNLGYDEFCSKSCSSSSSFKSRYEKRLSSTMKKHGVAHTTQLESVKRKMRETHMVNFGVEYASQSPEILRKMKDTNKERYGVEFPMQNKSIYKRSLVKINATNLVNNPEIRDKIKNNSLVRRGCEWPIQSPEVRNKIRDSKIKSVSTKIQDLYQDSDEVEFLGYDGVSRFKCKSCDQYFSISSSLLYQRYIKHKITICTNCNKINDHTSSGHLEICKYLNEIGIDHRVNVRDIPPYEIDIYIPKYKIGIEFNGVYWHSEIVKNKNYHIKKRGDCLSKGIDLIQIWEDDWKLKKDIVKSILSSRFGKSLSVKGSRKLKIERIKNEKLVKFFLNTNHLQGWSLSAIKYGLFEGDDLISIMTFSESRVNVSVKGWEIVRFCNKLDHTVLGSFNRLINKFIVEYNPISISSYSDNDIFNGRSYRGFNMVKSNESSNYWWCDGKVRHNRWKFRKDILVKEGNDPSLSGTQIMINKGYFRCWGSGTSKWVLDLTPS